jgi:heme exporter protein A
VSTNLLEGVDLAVVRGHRPLFEGVSFQVRSGHALIVRGRNGSGKTTLLRMVCGLTRPEHGSVLWNHAPLDTGTARQLAYAGHLPALKAELSVVENLEVFSRTYGVDPAGAEPLLKRLDIHRVRHLEVRQLSAGQRRRVVLARVFLAPAPVWVLDEPFANLDDRGKAIVEEIIGGHLRSGGLALLAVHESPRLGTLPVETLVLGSQAAEG